MADDNGISFDPDIQLARHDGWSPETHATDEQIDGVLVAATCRDSSLRMVSCTIDAFDVQLSANGGGSSLRRGILRDCFIMRITFQFFAQLPRAPPAPQTDQVTESVPFWPVYKGYVKFGLMESRIFSPGRLVQKAKERPLSGY